MVHLAACQQILSVKQVKNPFQLVEALLLPLALNSNVLWEENAQSSLPGKAEPHTMRRRKEKRRVQLLLQLQ